VCVCCVVRCVLCGRRRLREYGKEKKEERGGLYHGFLPVRTNERLYLRYPEGFDMDADLEYLD